MVGGQSDPVAATEARGGAAGGEEYLVGGVADVIAVEGVDAAEGPVEVLVEVEVAVAVVEMIEVDLGGGGAQVGGGFGPVTLTHVTEAGGLGGISKCGRGGGYSDVRPKGKEGAGRHVSLKKSIFRVMMMGGRSCWLWPAIS